MEAIMVRPLDIALALAGAVALGTAAGFFLRGWLAGRESTRNHRALDELRERSREPVRSDSRPARGWQPAAAAAAAAPADHSPQRVSGGSGPLILVVDDRLELRAVNGAYLAGHGYRVMEAGDGDAALEAVRRQQPDLILLDHSLPRRTGLEVVRELKADPATAEIPVVFMTAHSYGVVGRRAMAAGCVAFLPKPVDPSRVLMEVARHVGGPMARA